MYNNKKMYKVKIYNETKKLESRKTKEGWREVLGPRW
jgi:hypothetical protein